MKQHFPIIDVYISLLMFLVIIGHCLFPGYPEWYAALQIRIYAFHMAAFFCVCGFLVCHSYRPLSTLNEYIAYTGKRLSKFGIPFMLFGVILTCSQVLMLQRGTCFELRLALRDLLLYPSSSRVIYLWFIYLLFEFYLLAPLLCQFPKYSLLPALILAIILQFYPLPRLLCLNQFSNYYLFFILGICVRHGLRWLERFPVWLLALPTLAFLCLLFSGCITWPWFALLSIPSLFFLSWVLVRLPQIKSLSTVISRHCFAIYLWQMLFIQIWAKFSLQCLVWPYSCMLVGAIPVAIGGSLAVVKIGSWGKKNWQAKICA